ncbi:LexA family transcriptional regulator [Campylobacter fetus]|uniref:XRE family transcriptional regulator n=1 Tax=Campylobacter fetus TaxID=196 RepID=UPI0005091E92|nr:XRE family transcriptional regulator [Campylobacter fetus]WKW16808.1 XRE family transcriptional regulator [Campylobacter fetus subsp. fetus]AIR79028.1 putative transcriptional regulator, XRE family (peptidase S24 LexA-like domain) [Campylobacter fetus subsp. fetus 04/554]EAJ5692744.1 LexA family transcriptional regulator [Campylobacter fetus]EAJ9257146.1 LexA family transcriptional regulator [Campylobacter fetus]EAK0814312.1 LexA family transcriptional regulator [Campylobacter fetus]
MIGNKIRTLREENGISQKEFAKELGIAYGTLQSYEYGTTKPKTDFIEQLAKKFKIDVNYFYDDCRQYVVNMSSISSSKNKKLSSIVRQSPNLSSNKPLNTPNLKMSQDIINIPYFEDTYASAGSGIINYDETPIVMSFDINFLRVFLKITGSLNNLHIINAKGDSMEPTINGGELLYINPYDNEQSVISGCIYVINYDGDIFVKRVDKNPVTKSLTLISDNPKYEPIKIEATDLINCKIIGRVVAHTSRI